MVRFPATRNQIEQLEAIIPRQTGLHYLQRQAVSVGGLDIGSVDFDPARHMEHMIDPLAIMTAVTGDAQVRLQLPANPMLVTIVGDYRSAGDDPRVRSIKDQAISSISEGLESSVPNLDRLYAYKIEGDVADPEEIARGDKEILDLCTDGLCFVISDFGLFRPNAGFSQRADIIGVKVNHPIERQLPADVGRLPLGGIVEVDTDSPEQLWMANSMLNAIHQQTIARLGGLNVRQIVSLVASPNIAGCLDVNYADYALASAVRDLSISI